MGGYNTNDPCKVISFGQKVGIITEKVNYYFNYNLTYLTAGSSSTQLRNADLISNSNAKPIIQLEFNTNEKYHPHRMGRCPEKSCKRMLEQR